MTNDTWKVVAIGSLLLLAGVGVTAVVVSQKDGKESSRVASTKGSGTRERSLQAECREFASSQVGDKGKEVLKDAAIGGVAGAGTGAAGGAIAGGGSGAGKGAAIGGVVGVVGGTLYGMDKNSKQAGRYQRAYDDCMRSRG